MNGERKPKFRYIALMGDPTLRLEPIAPPSSLNASADPSGVHLSWIASNANVAGYYVYRSPSANGPYIRLNDSLLSGTTFTDVTAAPASYTYMVRAIALQKNFSGSYFDPSEGIFTSLTVAPPVLPILVKVSAQSNQVFLSWNSQAGVTYHVEAAQDLTQGAWESISAPVTATGTNTLWSETNANLVTSRFYRVTSP